MSVSVKMPLLGESVTEGTVTRWLKKEGDEVSTDEPLLEVSTDKVDTEIPAPATGVLLRILAQEDETVAVGAELAVIGGVNEAPLRSTADPEPATRTHRRPDRRRASEEAPAPAEPDDHRRPTPHPRRQPPRLRRSRRTVPAPRSCCPPWARASPRARSPGG